MVTVRIDLPEVLPSSSQNARKVILKTEQPLYATLPSNQ
jgi:hypothetical protein